MKIAQYKIVLFAAATAILFSAALIGAEPATVPTTQPVGTVRGRVSIAGGWDFHKPDLTRIVVYLASDAALDAPPTTERATIAQKNKTFVPNFLVVPRGTEVEFPNWDRFDHNVFSRSAAAPAFDLDRYPYGQSKTRKFEKLGVVQVFCNIHPQMRAVVYVTPNRFWARPDSEGRFEITGVPSGKYEVVAWNDRCEEQRQSVEIDADHPADLSLTLAQSRDRVLSESDRHAGYGGIERGLGIKRERLDLPVVKDSHPAPSN
jgi:plastocyanin